MKRRDFLTASGAGLAALTTTTALAADEAAKKEFVEVRRYTVKDAAKRAQLVEIFDKALVPALNRQGLKPIGVLVPGEKEEKYALNVVVLIPHKTMDSFLSVNAKLLGDSVYMKAAAPIFETDSKNPVYTDCETFLLRNFETVPVLEAPNLGPDRVLQWRLYRSFNIERNAAKIRMFDVGGEVPLFRELGLNPIFFGEVVAGRKQPCLLYMIGCASLEKHDETWQTFGSHPKWQAIRGNPEYKDTATEIESFLLKPSAGSQG
jgi:hypothetical protein